MPRLGICQQAALLLVSVVSLLCTASAQLEFDISSDGSSGLSSAGHSRDLLAQYAHNFGSSTPVSCYRSAYASPFRVYSLGHSSNATHASFVFSLEVATCPMVTAMCCSQVLDHLTIRTAHGIQAAQVTMDGLPVSTTVTDRGINLLALNVLPAPMEQYHEVVIVTNITVANSVAQLCPLGRFPDTCDTIAYSADEVCCIERSALLRTLVFPVVSPPPSTPEFPNLNPTGEAPPSPPLGTPGAPTPPFPSDGSQFPPSPGSVDAPPTPPPWPPGTIMPPPSPSSSSIPSPPAPPPGPPSPPFPPPPPPPLDDGCCIDELPRAPYRLTYGGEVHTRSDSAFTFKLARVVVNDSAPIYTAPVEAGNCSTMGIRNFGIAIYNSLVIQYVMFNNTEVAYSLVSDGVNGTFVYLNIDKSVDDFDVDQPVDVVITVRGTVEQLCPANDFFFTESACEYVIHGEDGEQECCPHGLTRGSNNTYDDCCIDDLPNTPYRVNYLASEYPDNTTVLDFNVQLAYALSNISIAGECTHMSMDNVSIQIYSEVSVQAVIFDGRSMAFSITNATTFSKWLNILDINWFMRDFSYSTPTKFEIVLGGTVREPCPASSLFGVSGVRCEYTIHGREANSTCCPHGLTGKAPPPGADCGCRDDVSETPFRLGYDLASASTNGSATTFTFDINVVDPNSLLDFDGTPDSVNGTQGADISCAAMGLKSIDVGIFPKLQVLMVKVGGFQYDFQTTPNTPASQWLTILDVDYSVAQVQAGKPLFVAVTVAGAVPELCPASAYYGSQSACEYVLQASSAECCPHGVTSWSGLQPVGPAIFSGGTLGQQFTRGL